ncbi:2,5-diketo-D-gluconic acid reductase B [Corynebacterium ciconiae DSM 44920]|uniref:aldo/keto reductase n=1 Tax=Corynebacterium ciconiae TaxID=227319 RepID=UPI00036B7682|nr:aldo/keto reductase [Corynebacterium ciconiae]WKD60309.1 2,5-diketo-D-gluconic acid reductase B [Corynebacterium ciconiae DSM 44920]
MDTFTSHTGLQLPVQGLGTYKLKGSAGVESIRSGIAAGYRLLDSAYNYENEGTVGTAVRTAVRADRSAARSELVITSKLPGRYHTEALTCVEESLYRLGLNYIDLYLIHWPNPKQGLFIDAYRGLMAARDKGLIRHIGVCNFLPEHLEQVEAATGELPAVNQIELHPYFPQTEARAYHEERGIITQSWSPLNRGEVFDEPVLQEIAHAHEATVAQTILAWHRAINALAIPKASSRERQEDNMAALEVSLDTAEVEAITALGRADGRRKAQDPAVYEEF